MSLIQGMTIEEFITRFEIGMVKVDSNSIPEIIQCLKDIPYVEDIIEERDEIKAEFDELKAEKEEFKSKCQQLELKLESIERHLNECYDADLFLEQVSNIIYPPKQIKTQIKRRRQWKP